MSKVQKGGKIAKKAPVEAAVQEESHSDLFMSKLTKEKRNLAKKVQKIDALIAKGGEMNEDQKASVSRKSTFDAEIKVLDQYMELYTKANPNWNVTVEVKVEEPEFTAESVSQDISKAVGNALLMFAQM